ncbi:MULTISPECIES: imidazole glycerol phosphate synthase subunit HisF [Thalassospira]|uniref:Imidazole glycerol phosphate synthase subunit HisF n=1 Tax=Thalassospira povalilytica TaxID=732237 RepID=A0A8I1M663_9PROT|nr:imidazole glycerol phosphate synthase cyclase subunit [Thalassospira povalilytica]MBN8195901.1 imidazole glycerol phosphate synthase subunit HisF [Thalassospira povalilytica]PKR52349.1 imidazole glycerol phosphate synthase subunit HisF [Thalassospira povalilytica]
MLKTRVIPTLLFKDFGLVKGKKFDSWRRVGSAMQAVSVYNMRDVDELIFLDISASPNGAEPDFEQVEELARECNMPLTVGGGVNKVSDIRKLLEVGADKVAINTAAYYKQGLVEEASKLFGSQCIVASVDVSTGSGEPEVVACCGTKQTGLRPVDAVKRLEASGAGEILLTSIDNDGLMNGYDIDLIKSVVEAVSIPVIASGGAGTYQHMVDAIVVGGASAVAAASIFHFTECTPSQARDYLRLNGIPTRK